MAVTGDNHGGGALDLKQFPNLI
jgi:hypothetical protein